MAGLKLEVPLLAPVFSLLIRLGCNSESSAIEGGGRSLLEAGARSSDLNLGLGSDGGPTFKVVCGSVFGLVGRESMLGGFGNVGGLSRGISSGELVGVTVGAIIGFEGAAFLVADVLSAGDRS